ncbi:MAG: GNAT family N-acetyltransferase [Acidimicrobiia bacterium]|nr:GNAT family N-acetyltransferase [Acidimicrobiia bacterium]
MQPVSRPASAHDLATVLSLYQEAVGEQAVLRAMWPIADGLPEPAETALASIVDDPDSRLVVGEIEGAVVGFAWARSEPLLPQAGGAPVCVVRLVYTTPEARGVGVGDAMLARLMDDFAARGHRHFDARVSPGHRHAKNFFEAHGFSARLIVMYHDAGAA